jgi:hypothetical protein
MHRVGGHASSKPTRSAKRMERKRLVASPTAFLGYATLTGEARVLLIDVPLHVPGVDPFLDVLAITEAHPAASVTRALLDRETQDVRVRAVEAAALFCYHVKKWMGAFPVAVGGVDTLVFAGCLGERGAGSVPHRPW